MEEILHQLIGGFIPFFLGFQPSQLSRISSIHCMYKYIYIYIHINNPVINGISKVNPLIIGVITHLLSGMSHKVGFNGISKGIYCNGWLVVTGTMEF